MTLLLQERWRTGDLTGEQKPQMTVRIRKGFWYADYGDSVRIDGGGPIFPPGLIWEGRNHSPWQGFWQPNGPWITLPNVEVAKYTTSAQTKGYSTATVIMDTIAFVNTEGEAGLFHEIVRGYYSPMRGVTVSTRPNLWASTGWRDILNGGWQIELWEGYGPDDDPSVTPLPNAADTFTWDADAGHWVLDSEGGGNHSCLPPDAAIKRTWTGLVVDCDLESSPDKATLTCQDFGLLLTDCRMMGTNKAFECRAPTTFADRRATMGVKPIYGNPKASSGTIATDPATGVNWTSEPYADPDTITWVEIELTKGYYTDFYVAPAFNGMEMWVSLKIGPGGGTQDRVHPFPEGWVDATLGNVPGGPPFIEHSARTSTAGASWSLGGHGWDVPDHTILRLSFRSTAKSHTGDGYVAGVNAFVAYWYGSDPLNPPGGQLGVNAKGWMLTDDAADVVRFIIMWCGFKEWHVEDFGWRLQNPMVFGEDKFRQDVIDEMLAQGDFEWYLKAPTDDDRSIGVPVFEHQAITHPINDVLVEIRDTDMTETMQVKWDLTNLPWVIRFRGNVNPNGQTLGQDLVTRFMATYYPPWSGCDPAKNAVQVKHDAQLGRIAGIRRHMTETIGATTTLALNSDAECMFAAILAAIQYAVAMCTGSVQIAGLPVFRLNEHVSVVDEGTGINSRMWIREIQSEHVMGEKGHWHWTLSGSFTDIEDFDYLDADYKFAWIEYQWQRAV